jgi:hypothetical protein
VAWLQFENAAAAAAVVVVVVDYPGSSEVEQVAETDSNAFVTAAGIVVASMVVEDQ